MRRLIFSGAIGLKVVIVAIALTVFAAGYGYSQDSLGGGLDPAVQMELNYAEQLIAWGMPKLAQTVLDRLKAAGHKGIEIYLQRIKIQSFIAVGNFDAVKEIIAKERDQESQTAWGLKLGLADGYYAWGKYAEAQAIYNAFFAKFPSGPPDDLNNFFMESAYKFARMLLLMGDKPAALDAYKAVLKAKVPSHIKRQIWSDTAELTLTVVDDMAEGPKRDKLIKEVEDLCSKILWVQDLWFGKAIVYLAHIEVLRGKPERAEKLIQEYKDQLKSIDEILQQDAREGRGDLTALSPMAECRYLIGKMMYDTAKKKKEAGNKEEAIELLLGKVINKEGKRSNGALHHFINVFIRYPSTSWAPDAGVKVDEVKALAIEELGVKEIKFKITEEQWEAVRQAQFLSARSLFNRNMFGEAVGAYIKVLNLFPEGETSVKGLSELARCFIEEEMDLEAEMTVRYISELFGKRNNLQSLAGDKVLSLATKYAEMNKLDEQDAIHNIYFKYFTKHGRAAAMLFTFGEKREKEENYEAALTYYNNIVANHKKSNIYKHALYKSALCYSSLGKQTTEIKYYQALIKYLEAAGDPDILILSSKFSIAQGYRKMARDMLKKKDSPKHQQAGNKYMSAAAGKYMELTQLLSKPDHPYTNTEDNKAAALKILEGSLFFKAYCYSYLTMPEEKVTAYKGAAIKGYKELVKQFPKSETYTPQALSQIATLYTMFQKVEEAQDALSQLKKNFPTHPLALNADFRIAMNLLEMDRKTQAIKYFKAMIDGQGKYSARQILIAGTELSQPNVGLYDIALEAFDKSLSMSEERSIVEPALLGKGRALTEMGKVEKAVETLDKLMTDYPNSGLTVETGFYLARSASSLAATMKDEDARFDMFNKAVAAIKRVQVHAKDDAGMKAKTNLEIGRIFKKKAEAEKAAGDEEKSMKYMEEAIASLQVMMMFADTRDPAVRPHLDDAFKEGIEIMFALERWEDVIADADKYLKQFATGGKNMSAVRSFKNKAVVKQRIAGGPTTTAPEEAPETAEAPVE